MDQSPLVIILKTSKYNDLPKMTTSQLNMVAQATSETSFIPNTPQTTENVQHHIGITTYQPQ